MNPLTNMKNVIKLSERELKSQGKSSWHDMYRDSAWIFVGGLPYDLTEGDVISVFSQYGEIVNINLIRDKHTGKSKGFCFICFEDQRSTVLTVDNLNGVKILGRTVRVDHVADYKPPKDNDKTDEETLRLYMEGCAPKPQKPVESIKRERVESPPRMDGDFKLPTRLPIGRIKVESTGDVGTDATIKKEHKAKKVKKEKKEKKAKKDKKAKKKKKRRKSSSSESSGSDSESEESSESESEEERNSKKARERNDDRSRKTDRKKSQRRDYSSDDDDRRSRKERDGDNDRKRRHSPRRDSEIEEKDRKARGMDKERDDRRRKHSPGRDLESEEEDMKSRKNRRDRSRTRGRERR